MSETKNTMTISIREELCKEFVKRSKKNPSYSIRAFAKYLDVDQSMLSKVMKGSKKLSLNNIKKIAPKVGISAMRMSSIIESSLFEPIIDYQSLEEESELLSNWVHFAILEMIKTKDFKLDRRYIAKQLSVHEKNVSQALERLERLKFIKFENNNITLLKPNMTWTDNAQTSYAKQRLQSDLLEKSLEAIENIPFESRDHGSLTVAVNKDRIPEFKEKLKQVRRELDIFFQPDENAKDLDQVYQLTLSFFPLSKTKEEIKES